MPAFQPPARRQPPRIVVLPPSAFADSWPDKPTSDVAVGLVLLSEHALTLARIEAAKRVEAMHASGGADERAVTYNESLMEAAVAAALADPNDARKSYWDDAPMEALVRVRLTPQALAHLWSELERLHIESSPADPSIDDAEIGELCDLLAGGALSALPAADAARVRRLFGHCLDTLREAQPAE